MTGNFVGEGSSKRSEAVDHTFWLGLSDRAVDILGSTAAAILLAEAFGADNPQLVFDAIDAHSDPSHIAQPSHGA